MNTVYIVLTKPFPAGFDPGSDCFAVLVRRRGQEVTILTRSVATLPDRQVSSLATLELVKEVLNRPPSREFRSQMLLSIYEVCIQNEERRRWEKTQEGRRWIARIEATKKLRA